MPRVPLATGAAPPLTAGGRIGDTHTRLTQHCFILSGPPNFGESLQNLHSPQSVAVHPTQTRQRFRRGALGFFFPDAVFAFFFGGGRGGVGARAGSVTG